MPLWLAAWQHHCEPMILDTSSDAGAPWGFLTGVCFNPAPLQQPGKRSLDPSSPGIIPQVEGMLLLLYPVVP